MPGMASHNGAVNRNAERSGMYFISTAYVTDAAPDVRVTLHIHAKLL